MNRTTPRGAPEVTPAARRRPVRRPGGTVGRAACAARTPRRARLLAAFVCALAPLPGLARGGAAPPLPPAPIVIAPSGVGAPARLDTGSLAPERPRFSPDGRSIVFHAAPPDGATDRRDVYVVAAHGGPPTRLTTHEADDCEPAWLPDGRGIVWASNRAGDYDLWTMALDGGDPHALFSLDGDEREPALNPIRHAFYAVSGDGEDRRQVDTYRKIAFTRRRGERSEVWFASEDGRHLGRLSAEGADCHAPAWDGGGLRLAWACAEEAGPVVHEGPARWEQNLGDALRALATPDTECRGDPRTWETDGCLRGLPRRYARYEAVPVSAADRQLGDPAYSANRMVLLAAGQDGRGGAYFRPIGEGGAWTPLPLTGSAIAEPDWSPDGARIAFRGAHDGHAALFLAATDFYLQEVRNLPEFPELWGDGASALLQRNRFVARPGREREFFAHHEQLAYRGRPLFVTTDAALQAFQDEFSKILRDAEGRAARDAHAIAAGLFEHYARGRDPVSRYLAVYFAVPKVLLEAGEALARRDEAARDEGAGWGEDTAPLAPVVDDLAAHARRLAARLPRGVRAPAQKRLDAVLAHVGTGTLDVPGVPVPALVDWTLFRVRGHYATGPLAGYFLAMSWFGAVPLPLDRELFRMERRMHDLPKDRSIPDKKGIRPSLATQWDNVDRTMGAFMGRPMDATLAHVRQLARERPALETSFDREAVLRELAVLRGPVPFRGLDGALGGEAYPLRVTLFPRRYGLDTEVFSVLTHPSVAGRGFPLALDVLAAFGVSRARVHALAAEGDAPDVAPYRERLDALRADYAARPAGFWDADLYHGWLSALVTLAGPPVLPATSPLAFARGEAWQDRLLHSALAGYTGLKHQAVLYAFQDYSVEKDAGRPWAVFVEQPLLPSPRGFVDPHPVFFERLGRLARRVYEVLNWGNEPTIPSAWGLTAYGEEADEEDGTVRLNAARFAETLATLARKEVAGEPLAEADFEWLREVAPMMEAMFLGRERPFSLGIDRDEGRARRGIAIATDVHTNPQRGEVLQEAVGRLMDLYVLVPDTVGQRLTEGALFSWYEFHEPAAERLDDDAWGARVEAGKLPPAAPWTRSFLEPTPRTAP